MEQVLDEIALIDHQLGSNMGRCKEHCCQAGMFYDDVNEKTGRIRQKLVPLTSVTIVGTLNAVTASVEV